MLKPMTLLLVTVICVLPVAAQGGSSNLPSELVVLHGNWFKAFDAGDGATMDKMETSNLVLIMPNGQVWPKDGPRAGSQTKGGAEQRTLSNVAVRQFGNAAILTGILTTKGGDDNRQMATTVVFVRSAEAWKIASAQWSPITNGK